MSDDDFIDVAATVAGVSSSSPSVHGGGGFGDGNDALRALSGRLGGDDDGGAMPSASASTSSQHHQSRPSASAPPHHRSKRGWFSSLFGGGGVLPSAVQAARFKTVRDRKARSGRVEKRESGGGGEKTFRCPVSLFSLFFSFYSPRRFQTLSLSPSLFPATGHRPPGPLVSWQQCSFFWGGGK